MWEEFGIQSHVEKTTSEVPFIGSKVSDFSFPLLSSLTFVHRDLLTIVCREIDPEGAAERRKRRLKRRVYVNKVSWY